MQETKQRAKWQIAAAKDNKATAPTAGEILTWDQHTLVSRELSEFYEFIWEMKAVLETPDTGDLADVATHATKLMDRCKVSSSRRGACVRVGNSEQYASAHHLLRMAANTLNTGDERNMLQRFARTREHNRSLIKDPDAFENDFDLRVGRTVMAMFKTEQGELTFYAGQLRHIVASVTDSSSRYAVKQAFLSVSHNDSTASYLCHPWANVDPIHGDVHLCPDEPIEFYKVHGPKPKATLGREDSEPVGGDDDEAGPIEMVTMYGSSIVLRDVAMDWANLELLQPEDVLPALQDQMNPELY